MADDIEVELYDYLGRPVELRPRKPEWGARIRLIAVLLSLAMSAALLWTNSRRETGVPLKPGESFQFCVGCDDSTPNIPKGHRI